MRQDIPDDVDENPRAVIGGNQATKLDELLAKLEGYMAAAKKWMAVTHLATEEEAAALKGFRAQVRELQKEGEVERKRQQEAHREEIKAIAERFAPIEIRSILVLNRTAPALEAWLQAEQAKIDAEAKRLREEAAAEQRRLEALTTHAADPHDLEVQALALEQAKATERAQKEAKAAEGQRAKVGGDMRVGGQKRSASLVTDYDYAIKDRAALLAFHMLSPTFLVDLDALLLKSVRGYHRSDRARTFPGVVITERKVVRG